jgi:hypothetical protein
VPLKATGEVRSEGHEEKYRAVIDGGYSEFEPVGPRWDQVESVVESRRVLYAPDVAG